MSIIGAEDEDFENDLMNDAVEDQTHFTSIEQLRERPTHLLVFLQHVILQFDPAPLLCYLHAELFKNLNAKETKKQFMEFYNTFLDKGAILRVSVPTSISYDLDRTRPDLLSDDTQRRYAHEIQGFQVPEVTKQLEDFRQKRMMGMTQNEKELIDVESHYPTDRIPMEMKEKSVAENLLDKMSETQPTSVADEEKCQSIFTAVAFYMKHLGVKSRAVDSKKSRGGFFKRAKNRKEESAKGKPRGVFPSIPSWIAGNTEVKPKSEAEGEKEKVTIERKGPSSGRGSLTEQSAPSLSGKKIVASTGPASPLGLDMADSTGNNISTANSPESVHTDGPVSHRLEPTSLSDAGDISPVTLMGGLPVIEPLSPSDTALEESLERDSFEGAVSGSEGPGTSPTSPSPQLEEMDARLLEFEADPPNWREMAPPEALSSLGKKETKRQEVINELFATEHAHVRMLSVLQTVFSKPLEREELLSSTDVATIFPSLDEIIDVHYNFYENLKKLRMDDNFIVKSIRTTVLSRFDGAEGEWFQKLTARFCSHQSWALDQIKSRQKKDPRFNSFIQEAESKPQCRRLQLKDIIPIEMQRLTKYPLLLENIAKNTEDPTEKEGIQQSAECCRKILNHVNEEVKLIGNLLTLKDYQRRLDTSGLKPSTDLYTEYKNIDLTQKTMLYEGPLTWRVTKEKAIEVQCVLLVDLLVLLQKQDDKMVLKCHSKSNIAVPEGKQMLSPIIKLDSVFLREVATDPKAFYVIFTWDSGAQIYELVAQSAGERKFWSDILKTAVDDLKKSGASKNLTPPPNSTSQSPLMHNSQLSLSENGSLKGERERDKDILTDDKSTEYMPKLIDYLSDKGFDLIGHSRNQEKVADSAIDEAMILKRLLVASISLSDDVQLDELIEEEQAEGIQQYADSYPSTEENQKTDGGREETENSNSHEKEARPGDEEERNLSVPLVLPPQRVAEIHRRLHRLQEQLKRLQTVEEDHHRLLEVLSQCSLLEARNLP